MISLKRYLDAANARTNAPEEDCSSPVFPSLLAAYRSGLAQVGECGGEACPIYGAELKRGLAKIDAELGDHPGMREVAAAECSLSELLEEWGKKAAEHYQQKAREVKDLLLVMARTAESLGHKDERYAQQLDSLTARLETVASLDDVAKIRASVEQSARELKKSVTRMTAESKAVIDHLRAEVSTYQTKLEKAEYIASCDSLTGLGSRFWVEGRIQQRIDSALPFSILIIDINGFRRVNDEHGNLVGDLLLKEFARELRSCCRFTDLLARWGGDRFIAVLDCCGSDAEGQTSRLQAWIAKSYHVPGRTGYLSLRMEASIGRAEWREGDTLYELLERADAQLATQRSAISERLTA